MVRLDRCLANSNKCCPNEDQHKSPSCALRVRKKFITIPGTQCVGFDKVGPPIFQRAKISDQRLALVIIFQRFGTLKTRIVGRGKHNDVPFPCDDVSLHLIRGFRLISIDGEHRRIRAAASQRRRLAAIANPRIKTSGVEVCLIRITRS